MLIIFSSVDGLGIRVDELQPSIPPPKSHIDYSHEASEYEQKLIQVGLINIYLIHCS